MLNQNFKINQNQIIYVKPQPEPLGSTSIRTSKFNQNLYVQPVPEPESLCSTRTFMLYLNQNQNLSVQPESKPELLC